jgi:hypothetical protein
VGGLIPQIIVTAVYNCPQHNYLRIYIKRRNRSKTSPALTVANDGSTVFRSRAWYKNVEYSSSTALVNKKYTVIGFRDGSVAVLLGVLFHFGRSSLAYWPTSASSVPIWTRFDD